MKYINSIVLFFVFLIGCWSCANIIPPDGGPVDNTPPTLLSLTPPDSGLNVKPKKLVLRFDKYMEVKELDKHLHLSPMLDINPVVTSYGKRIEILIEDTLLKDNTTYQLKLGNALVDNRESTPFENFTYTFSTGAYFDSLFIVGYIIDAASGLPDTAAGILIYDAETADSNALRQKPLYTSKVSRTGRFEVPMLPYKAFKLIALTEEDNNLQYEIGKEKIGFYPASFWSSGANDTSVAVLYTFQEEVKDDSTAKKSNSGRKGGRRGLRGDNAPNALTSKVPYLVHIDTSNAQQRTIELDQEIRIAITTPNFVLDTPKIHLSYDDEGIDVGVDVKIIRDSLGIALSTSWQSDKQYTLRLINGWAKDTAGNNFLPSRYRFRTKRTADYATLIIHTTPQYAASHYVLSLYQDADSVYQQPITDSIITFKLLKPGNYHLKIIEDLNKNGKWDTGEFLTRKEAEKVFPYKGVITLKAGWENDIYFEPLQLHFSRQEGSGGGSLRNKSDEKDKNNNKQ